MNESNNNIREFYKNTNILITGSTGFIGQLLVEKLLRSCPEIKHIYVLIRDKKGETTSERIENYFEKPLFETLKEINPQSKKKVTEVVGDLSKPSLDLNDEDQQILIKNVNIVFHVAANLGFLEKIRTAVSINLIGSREVLNLCKKMENLKVAMFVSTAYSNCPWKTIRERIYTYPNTITWDRLVKVVNTLNDKELQELQAVLLQDWPNTYCFSKAMTETMIQSDRDNVSVGVFRPGIVISTAYEPIKGWVDNFQSATTIIATLYSGLLKSMMLNQKANTNMVPGDMCVHALIASAWDVANYYQNQAKENIIVPVYNYSLSNSLTWGGFFEHVLHLNKTYPLSTAMLHPFVIYNSSTIVNRILQFFLHTIPAYIIHFLLVIFGKKSSVLRQYRHLKKMLSVTAYFCTREWIFETNNIINLWQKLSPEEKNIFKFNLQKIKWSVHFEDYVQGIRQLLLKEHTDTLSYARKRRNVIYFIHQVLIGILLLIVFSWIFSTFFW